MGVVVFVVFCVLEQSVCERRREFVRAFVERRKKKKKREEGWGWRVYMCAGGGRVAVAQLTGLG